MKRKNTFLLFLCSFFIVCPINNLLLAQEVYSFNTGWGFCPKDIPNGSSLNLDDSNFMAVSIPHCMRLEKKHCGGDHIFKGIGWYRRYFKLNKEDKGKKIFFDFEGVMKNCQIFINGQKVDLYGRKNTMRELLPNAHYGGYLGFRVDATKLVNFEGNNVLAVRVDAADDPLTPPGKSQGKMDFYYYSGIYRDVKMVKSNCLRISHPLEIDQKMGGGVFFRYQQKANDDVELIVRTNVINDFQKNKKAVLVTSVYTDKKELVASDSSSFVLEKGKDVSLSQHLLLKKPHLWNINDPYRYLVKNEILFKGKVIDATQNYLGIRFFKMTRQGFYMNEGIKTGQKTYLRGANRHQSYANVGDAASNSMQERDVIQLKQGGYNAVRAAHYPQDPAFLDACDKYGLLVLECIPGWQYYNADSIFNKRLFTIAKEMIRRDRNHASIFLWEMALNESRYPIEVAQKLYDIAHGENPTDQMYISGDYYGHEDMKNCFDVFYKQVSKFPKDGNVNSNYKEDQVSIAPLFTREWGDGAGEKPRVSFLENEEEQMKQCRGRFEQLNGHGYFDWCMLDANQNMAGHFLWSYNDYARGCCEETMFCGVVDINRRPKFSYYMMQSMRDKNDSQLPLYQGPMVHIASYNDASALASSSKSIMVFSNCDAVKLYRNNKIIGTQTRKERARYYQNIVDKGGSPAFVFKVENYEAGELKAEGLINHKVVATHLVRTPLKPHHIEIEVAVKNIPPIADGSDMIPIYFKICDKNGSVVTNDSSKISISVEGEGSLIGQDNKYAGIEQQKVEGGVGYAFIRTTTKAGKIMIKVSAERLPAATSIIFSKATSEAIYPDESQHLFKGKEYDFTVNTEKKSLSSIVKNRKKIFIPSIEVVKEGVGKKMKEAYDSDPNTWWVSRESSLPQVFMVTLSKPTYVYASQIMFQKDSSSYLHCVEISKDGETWEKLYERSCTGWDFQPYKIDKKFQFMRITIKKVSEGNAGFREITLYE